MIADSEAQPPRLEGRRIWVMAKGYASEEGGMQTYAEGVAQAYARAGAATTVFTQTTAGPRSTAVGSVGLIDVGNPRSVLMPMRLLAAMRREKNERGAPFLVHGTTWRTSVLPMLSGLPYVTTFHGREFMRGGELARRLIRSIATRARAVVAVSGYGAARLRARLGENAPSAIVAWNGLGHDFRAAMPSSAERGEPPLILSLCRLEPRKNIAACIRALGRLRDEGLRFRYVVGGRGPALVEVQRLVEHNRLSDLVEVAGYIPSDRVADLYLRADIFLHPQIAIDQGRDFEGFGIAIADAMAAETAVIVGREGGAAELIEQDVTGLAVDGTDFDELCDALRRLLISPDLRRDMAAAARRHAEHMFSWDRHIALVLAGAAVSNVNG